MMIKIFPALFLFLSFSLSSAAQQKPSDLDKSPMDVSYSPPYYPILKMNGQITTGPNARVIYSRPQKAGRSIFGGIVTYNKVWRLGANEATEIEFFKHAKIGDKHLSKGRYSLYAICTETTWTIIFNSENDVWGLYYNPKNDVFRTDVPVTHTENAVEALTIYFEDMNEVSNLIVQWDTTRVVLPIVF